jgi:hypothetical protein
MPPHDYVLEFMGAANEDLYMVDAVIDDQSAPDSGIGFHCQQAAEKLLKAVLATRGVHFGRTHDLKYLFELVASSGTPAPAGLNELTELNPFATVLRYTPSETVPDFDRLHTRELIEELRVWAAAQVTTP